MDTAGFIGSLDDVYVVGRRLDFLRSVWSEQVTLSDVPLAASGWRDVYSFNGTGFAEFGWLMLVHLLYISSREVIRHCKLELGAFFPA